MKNKFGKIGFVAAIAGVLIAILANYVYVSKSPYEWFFLSGFETESGSLNSADENQEWELKEAPIFPITEKNMILIAYTMAVILSLTGMVCSVIAEIKKEYTLFSASALVFGGTGIILVNQFVGYFLLISIFMVAMYVRRKK